MSVILVTTTNRTAPCCGGKVRFRSAELMHVVHHRTCKNCGREWMITRCKGEVVRGNPDADRPDRRIDNLVWNECHD